MTKRVEPLPREEDEDSPQAIERAWADEIHRRLARLRAGEVELIDGDEALARIRARIKSHGG